MSGNRKWPSQQRWAWGICMYIYTFVPNSNMNNLGNHCSPAFASDCRQLRNDSHGKDASEAHTGICIIIIPVSPQG